MRKYLGVALILPTMFLFGCGKEVSKEFLVISNGKFYEKGSHEPYSGTALNDNYLVGYLIYPFTIGSGVKISCTSKIIDGVYDGPVSCKDENTGSLVMEASFKNGKKDGRKTIYNPATKDLIQVSNWENGILNGQEQNYVDGKILCETEYKDGKIHGKQVCWGAGAYTDSSTWKNAYKRLETFKDDEKTIDAIFENGEIKNGLFTSASWKAESNGVTYWVTQQNISEGKKDGRLEYFKVLSSNPMNRLPIAIAEYKNGTPIGKFTFYANDGKSICSEKTYENGVAVSGFLNTYTKHGDFVGQVKLVKDDAKNIFVPDGNEKEMEKYDDRGLQCKTTETTWEKGIRLKEVVTLYDGRNFDVVSSVSTQELIKESISANNKSFTVERYDFCSESWDGGLGSDIVEIEHKLYRSKFIGYENNAPKTETVCTYGSTISSYGDTLWGGAGCTEKRLWAPGEQELEQKQAQEQALKQAQENKLEQEQEQEQERAQEREYYLASSLSPSDDCNIDLSTAGISAKITDTSDIGGKTQISIMFSNASENNYEVPVIRIGSCEFVKSDVLFPEMSGIKPGETITQSYLCGADFKGNDLSVKMYLKYPGAGTATSSCTTISSTSQQPVQ